jgi:hypothetical protein
MAGGLTYANTLGAIEGINQSGSGVTIPDTFLRWAQDVLFDNNGIIKRRAPFQIFTLYNVAGTTITQPSTNTSFITTGASGSSGTATLTFANHTFTIGQPIVVSGVTPTSYNGSYIVTATTPTTISYASSATGSQTVAGSVIASSERVVSTITTINPAGDRITGLVTTFSGGSRILFYDSNNRGPYISVLGSTLLLDSIFDFKQASTTGAWLSFLNSYATGTSTNAYTQYYWRGGCGVETSYSGVVAGNNGVSSALRSGTTNAATASYGNYLTFTPSSGSIVPAKGMFVYLVKSGVEYYAGTVSAATSGSITLEKDLIRPGGLVSGSVTTLENARTDLGTAGYTIKTYNLRPYTKAHARGLMTLVSGASSTITSGNAGTDGEGHWKSAGIDGVSGNYWALYRASDGAWVGDVGSVTDNTTMIGSSTSYPATSITMRADEYIARPYTNATISPIITNRNNIATSVAGIFVASYAGLQWYGNAGDTSNRNRIVFSNYSDCEAVDLSANDADSIVIPSLSEMRGMATSSAGLLVFMADKTFIVRGNSRFNFSLEELYPEGCLSSMSIVEYGGGVFWTSRTGIFYFDGTTVRNLTKDNLGSYYSQSLKEFNINQDRVYGFFHKDYLFMHFTAWKSTYKPIRYEPIYADGIATTPAIKDYFINNTTNDTTINGSFDPDFTINDFSLDSNTPIYWSYNTMYSGGGSTTATITATSDVYQNGFSVVGSSGNGTTVTLTLGSVYSYSNVNNTIVSTPLAVGNSIIVSGLTAATGTYNGTFTITSVNTSTNTITYTGTGTGSLTTTGYIYTGTAPSSTSIWGTASSQLLWGPADVTESFTLAIYLPTGAITCISNFGFRNAIKIDSNTGLKALMGVNILQSPYVYPRFVDVDSILMSDQEYNTNVDAELIENNGIAVSNYYKGPDFYIQTKHYTMGDPLLKKWFKQMFLNLYLIDGCVRLDMVDNEDNDQVDVRKKQHKYWELFTNISYTWDQLETLILPAKVSPNRSTWGNVENLGVKWFMLTNTNFERRKKRFSWRNPSFGFRLYQINNYRPYKFTLTQRPFNVILESWDIGFKPMRQSRV